MSLGSYDAALWAAADRYMSEGTGPEGTACVTIRRAWLGLPDVELSVEAEAGESTGVVLEATALTDDDAVLLDLRLVAPSALRVVLTAEERDEVALEVSEHARENAEAERDYWAESRER